jgi:Raf kinase inhibitor-like YbhB/YbcL family protein
MIKLEVSSSAFEDGSMIPARYTCDGENINPPLSISNVPAGAESLVIVLDDPDSRLGSFIHWLMWNIDPRLESMGEDSAPGILGKNNFNKNLYGGPCPPSRATHRYLFKVYALDIELNNRVGSIWKDIDRAMQGHIIAHGELMGKYTGR